MPLGLGCSGRAPQPEHSWSLRCSCFSSCSHGLHEGQVWHARPESLPPGCDLQWPRPWKDPMRHPRFHSGFSFPVCFHRARVPRRIRGALPSPPTLSPASFHLSRALGSRCVTQRARHDMRGLEALPSTCTDDYPDHSIHTPPPRLKAVTLPASWSAGLRTARGADRLIEIELSQFRADGWVKTWKNKHSEGEGGRRVRAGMMGEWRWQAGRKNAGVPVHTAMGCHHGHPSSSQTPERARAG